MTATSLERPESLHRDPPGLELARHLQRVAPATGDMARKLLSWLASSLVRRGWIQSIDKCLDLAAEQTDLDRGKLAAALDELVHAGLVELDGTRVASISGLLSTRPTGVDFVTADGHTVHLLGPLAALAAAQALQQAGEIRATCLVTGKRLVLGCDTAGIASRDPETICVFLPAWEPGMALTAWAALGGFFADDEALGQWQEDKADPAGMPMTSFLFPMAATDLGASLGKALEDVLNHLPDFS